MRTVAKVVAALAATFYLVFGVWAFVAPASFAENIASYPPYNEHLVHDGGAFTIGLGVAALAGLVLSDALTAVLAGVAAGSLLHGVSHIVDDGLGGRSSDPWVVSAIGLVVLCGFVIAARFGRAGTRGRSSARSRPLAASWVAPSSSSTESTTYLAGSGAGH
ncbi:MAG: hypothetical protein ACRDTA_04120 [Pseudonocardiaceae bacterium]